MKVKVQTLAESGSAQGGDIELKDEIFGLEPRADILHRVVTWQLINRRAPARAARERSEVIAPARSSASRRAAERLVTATAGRRSSSAAARPTVLAAGVRSRASTRRFARSGLKMALSSKASDGNLVVLDNLDVAEGKTKALKAQLGKLGFGKTALVIDGDALNVGFARASSNLDSINLLPAIGANVYDIMRHETLVLTRAAVEKLEARFNG